MSATNTHLKPRRLDTGGGGGTASGWFHRPSVGLARLLWSVFVAPVLALVALAVPGRLAELQALADQTTRAQPALAPALDFYPIAAVAFEVIVILMFALISMVVLWRRSVDWMALFIAVGLVAYITCITPPLDTLAGHPLWGGPAALFEGFGLVITVAFLAIFPNGRFVPRWIGIVLPLYAALVVADLTLPAHPFGFANVYTLPPLGAVPQQLALGLGVVAQIQRFRNALDPIQRQQTKWLLYSMAVAMVGGASYNVTRAVVETLPLTHPLVTLFVLFGIPLFLVFVVPIPLAFAFSILRYRLWDIDSLISRTLAYGLLTATLLLIYVTSVIVLQRVVLELTGQESELAVVISTLAIAALFHPLRHHFQRQIDRRFYRRHYDTALALAAFGGTVRDEVDLSRLATGLVGVVHESLGPAHISLWLRPARGHINADTASTTASEVRAGS